MKYDNLIIKNIEKYNYKSLLVNKDLILEKNTLEFLRKRNIKIFYCNIDTYKLSFYNVDCFAFKIRSGKFKCNALTEINCNNCKFYRNNTTKNKIESDVKKYIKKWHK